MRDWSREGRWLAPFCAIALASLLFALRMGRSQEVDSGAIIAGYAFTIFLIAPFVILVGTVGFVLHCALHRESRPFAAAGAFLHSRFQSPASLGAALIAVFSIPVLMGSYGVLKMLMPLSSPFAWDDALARMDRLLFLGQDPWRITHALFGAALPTQAMDFAYTLWVPLVMVGVLCAAMAPAAPRARYLLSFALAWPLIGVFGAFALSSAGPCYSAAIGAETASWFTPLMERLAAHHESVGLKAVDWQGLLWQSYTGHEYKFGRGISAAPSMHNSICMLYVLALRSARPLWRIGSIVFAGLIFVASVHLGWHYAVDGLLGWALMVAIWKAAGAYLRWAGYPECASPPETASEPAAA